MHCRICKKDFLRQGSTTDATCPHCDTYGYCEIVNAKQATPLPGGAKAISPTLMEKMQQGANDQRDRDLAEKAKREGKRKKKKTSKSYEALGGTPGE